LSWKFPIMFSYVRNYPTPKFSWTRHSEPPRTNLRKYRSFVIPYVTEFVTPSIIGIRVYGCDIYSQVGFLYLHRNSHLPRISFCKRSSSYYDRKRSSSYYYGTVTSVNGPVVTTTVNGPVVTTIVDGPVVTTIVNGPVVTTIVAGSVVTTTVLNLL
jgi:hypothetical protein